MFSLTSRIPVPALSLTLETWRHPCGAVHFHLACPDEHRAFTVAFRTPPADSTGLPHILEHTTLCGSRRFPVRDPFFNMLRRSLQTFMNAMTYPELTAYPFATQIPKDFSNLLEVYLDAVFAPILHPLDFAQEGHRLSPTATGWERAGVVFNEMKGAMDDTGSQVEAACARALLPDTMYAHNSGGDPSDIPRLTHADLVAFHQRCYAPANACFVTYGAWEPANLHERLQPYLVNPGKALPPPTLQPPLGTATTVTVPVPWADGQDEADVANAGITWVWGDSAAIDEVLTGELIDRLLLGHPGAPLRRALEGSGLGRSTGSSGYGASYRNGLFTAELDGILASDHHRLEPLVFGCLEQVAQEGLPAAEIEAALHQVELARREIHGDHYPYGLELCFRLLGPWNHGADVLQFLDQAPAIARLRTAALAPGWLQEQVRRRLLTNLHRVELRAVPDRAWHARRDAAEAVQVAAEVAALGPEGEASARVLAADLALRQGTKDDPAVLPDLTLEDIPKKRSWVEGHGAAPTIFVPGTNGILHHLAVLPLDHLEDDDLDLLPLLAQCLGSLGAGGRGFAAYGSHLNAVCGGLWAWTDLSADPAIPGAVRASLACEVKGLASRGRDFLPLLGEAIATTRFHEHERLAELVDQALSRLQDRVTSGGSQLAARAAARGLPGAAGISHRVAGLGRLAWLRRTADSLETEGGVEALATRLEALRQRIARLPAVTALIGDAAERDELLTEVRRAWPVGGKASDPWRPTPQPAAGPTAFTTATGVNYCALVFAGPPLTHADAPALAVAARLLTNEILHPQLRERGGAYGGGASFASGTGTIALTSYRDPRLEATYTDMRAGLTWLADCPATDRLLKESVLGVIGTLDAPGSPAGEARSRFTGGLKGTSPEVLDTFRAGVLRVTAADIRAAAARWMPPTGGQQAVVCGTEAAKRTGWVTEAI